MLVLFDVVEGHFFIKKPKGLRLTFYKRSSLNICQDFDRKPGEWKRYQLRELVIIVTPQVAMAFTMAQHFWYYLHAEFQYKTKAMPHFISFFMVIHCELELGWFCLTFHIIYTWKAESCTLCILHLCLKPVAVFFASLSMNWKSHMKY